MQSRTTYLAQAEINKALALAPNDPLINLWKLVLDIHKGDYSVQEGIYQILVNLRDRL